MRFDGYVGFALVFLAVGALVIYELSRPSARSVVETAADGADAEELAALMHAARADVSPQDADPWYHFPWGINGMKESAIYAGNSHF